MKLGPWLFALMINDLSYGVPFYWKFVDDTTASEIVLKGCNSNAQDKVDNFTSRTYKNRVQLDSADKCKEFRISFSTQLPLFDPF